MCVSYVCMCICLCMCFLVADCSCVCVCVFCGHVYVRACVFTLVCVCVCTEKKPLCLALTPTQGSTRSLKGLEWCSASRFCRVVDRMCPSRMVCRWAPPACRQTTTFLHSSRITWCAPSPPLVCCCVPTLFDQPCSMGGWAQAMVANDDGGLWCGRSVGDNRVFALHAGTPTRRA